MLTYQFLHTFYAGGTPRLALYDLAVARFGKYEGFEFLKYPGDRMDQLQSEFFEIYFAETGQIIGQEDG